VGNKLFRRTKRPITTTWSYHPTTPSDTEKRDFVRQGVFLFVSESLGIGQGYGSTLRQHEVLSFKSRTSNREGKSLDVFVYTVLRSMVQRRQRCGLNREEALVRLSSHGRCLSIRAKRAPTSFSSAKLVDAMHATYVKNLLER